MATALYQGRCALHALENRAWTRQGGGCVLVPLPPLSGRLAALLHPLHLLTLRPSPLSWCMLQLVQIAPGQFQMCGRDSTNAAVLYNTLIHAKFTVQKVQESFYYLQDTLRNSMHGFQFSTVPEADQFVAAVNNCISSLGGGAPAPAPPPAPKPEPVAAPVAPTPAPAPTPPSGGPPAPPPPPSGGGPKPPSGGPPAPPPPPGGGPPPPGPPPPRAYTIPAVTSLTLLAC